MRRALAVLIPLALTACASIPQRPPVADPEQAWAERRARLSDFDYWEVKGRLGVRTIKRGGQATLVWRRNGSNHRMQMYGPLGGGRVVLTQDDSGAQLRDAKKNTYQADTAEEVLYRAAGWRVPFEFMTYWITGVPAPGGGAEVSLDAWGRLARIRQGGWEVEYREYRQVDNLDLPRKIFVRSLPGTVQIAEADPAQKGQMEVRLVIKRWRL